MYLECYIVSFEFDLVLKSFSSVSRKLKGCFEFQGCFKEVSRKFQGYFKEVLRVFTKSLKGVSSIFKEVSRVFERS